MKFFRPLGTDDPVPAHSTGRGVDHGRRIGVVLRKVLYRNTVRGLTNVPDTGGVLFVANHTNYIDGPVLFGILPRRVSFLVKAEAVTGGIGWVLTKVGQYAVRRGVPDRKPLLEALGQLQSGGCIGIFPEGTRGDGTVENVFNGAGWLAVRSKATVVPIAIRGTARPPNSRRRLKPRVDVLIGEPFVVPPGAGKSGVDAATAEIQQRLAALVARLDHELAAPGQQTGSDA